MPEAYAERVGVQVLRHVAVRRLRHEAAHDPGRSTVRVTVQRNGPAIGSSLTTMSSRNSDDDPNDAEVLAGFDPEALELAIAEAEADGQEIDLEALAQLLGVDAAWIEREHGDDHELVIELDEELAAKLASDLGLDLLNSPGGDC